MPMRNGRMTADCLRLDQAIPHINAILRDWYNEQDQFAPIKAVFAEINKESLRPPPLPPSGGPCEKCTGAGRLHLSAFPLLSRPCPRCKGKGWLTSEQRVQEREPK